MNWPKPWYGYPSPFPPCHHLILRLHLVVPLHSLSIRRRSMSMTLAAALATITTVWLIRVWCGSRRILGSWCARLVSNSTVGSHSRRVLVGLAGNVVVCHTPLFRVLSRTARTARDGLVVGIIVIGIWVFDDYVPCVEETGDVAEAAKGEVDD